MRSTCRNNNIITFLRIDDLGLQPWGLGDVEAHGAFCDEEGFVVHFVPVRGRTCDDQEVSIASLGRSVGVGET